MISQALNHLTLVIVLIIGGAAGCQPEESMGEQGSDKSDGLLDFSEVRLNINAPAYYACDEDISDNRCFNDQRHGRYLSIGQQAIAFDSQSTVRWASQQMTEVVIDSEDLRFLVPADKTFVVDDFSSVLRLKTRIGLKLDFRVDGESSWRTAIAFYSAENEAFEHLQNLKILPSEGLMRARVTPVCQGSWCITNKEPTEISFDKIPANAIVEYRLVFMPVWNIGDFDEGRYDFSFTT